MTPAHLDLLLETCLLAGKIMIESDAEMYRVEDTMSRIALASGNYRMVSYVTQTGLFVGIDGTSTIRMVQVMKRGIDLEKISRVNQLSRAYVAGDYHTAIRQYESLLQGGVNAEVYYNLGNSYFKVDDIARAILNYERALLMSPGNGDIRANLEIARAKTVDKVVPQPELFFVNWYLSLRAVMSVDGWATVGILTFLIFLIGMGLYFFVSAIHLRKVGFYVAVVSVCLCLLSNLFAYQQKEIMQRHDKAIILVPSVTVRSTPSESGTGLFILHEGHKVSIKDDSMREWREIVIEDGKVGWVRLADIGII